MSTEPLKPCPFCGDTELINSDGFVQCQECGAEGPCTSTGNSPRAAMLWNKRFELRRIVAYLEGLGCKDAAANISAGRHLLLGDDQ